MFKVKLQQFVTFVRRAKSPHSTSLKSNKASGVHGETQDTPIVIDYYDNDIDESNTDKVNTLTEEPLYDNIIYRM